MSSGLSLSGLASGLDSKAIVEQLMVLERRPLNLLKAKQSSQAARMAAIKSVKDLITSLRSTAAGLADRAKVNAKSAVTDTPSTSPPVLTASTTADAMNGSFKVTVSKLATSTRLASGGPVGTAIDKNATLGNAGFRYAVNTGTFRINGQVITVDENTTLDGTDPNNSLIAKINNSGAGVTASLVADADGRGENRIQITAPPGQAIHLGSQSDTSNALRLLNLSDAVITGVSPSSTNSGVAANVGVLNTSITINGVTTAISQSDGGFTSAQNAQFIAQAINDNQQNTTVTATAQPDGSITLAHKVQGSQQKIEITAAGTGTGLANGTTQNGTDRVVSSTNLGVTDLGASPTNARLVTLIADLTAGNGKFKINDVEISYKSTDSITTIVNRINASAAGVTAFFDPVQDRLRLTASQTGARTMTLEETAGNGNFLAATGLLGATQQLGQNALFSIDEVNGGAELSSATNSVTGYIPGVTLALKSVSASPVTVTVAQNPQATTETIKAFVTEYNDVLQKIEDLTKYDLANKTASPLTGDAGLRDIQRQLRLMVSGAALGASGTYRTLASIGVSFGAVGSAAGSTNRLVVDDAKLSAALAENAQAVESLLAGFAASTGTPTGAVVTAVSGTPQVHQDGTYHVKITDASTGAFEATFVNSGGRTTWTRTGRMVAGQDSYGIIPGLKISAGTLTDGAESTFTVTVTNKGIGVGIGDYLSGLTDKTGYFADREKSSKAANTDYDKRVASMQDRLDRKQASLEKKYAALEVALSKMQSQSNSVLSQLAGLNSNSR